MAKYRRTMLSRSRQITESLAAEAVTLRIDAGSQEAGFLSAYYAVPVIPAVIIIR